MLTHNVTGGSAVLVEQGIAAMKAGNKEGAEAALRLAVEMEPRNETAWLWLASLYTELPLVTHCLQRVVAINPNNEQATRALQARTQKTQAAQGIQAPPTQTPVT